MIVATALVLLIVVWVAATAVMGRTRNRGGWAQQVTLALPFMAVCAAPALDEGMGWGMAVVAAGGVALALILPALFPQPESGQELPARGTASWLSGAVASLLLGAALLSWAASVIQFSTPLNRTAVVLILVVAAAAVAAANGAGVGWNRVVATAAIVSACLLLVGGFVVGAPDTLFSPVLETSIDGAGWQILMVLFLVVVGLGHPGVQRSATLDRPGLVIAGVVMGLVTLVGLAGLLMIMGGWITAPDFSLFVVLSFMPPVVGAVVGTILALIAVMGVGRSFTDLWQQEEPNQLLTQTGTRYGGYWWRWGIRTCCVLAVAGLALVPVHMLVLAGVAAIAALVSIFARGSATTDEADSSGDADTPIGQS